MKAKFTGHDTFPFRYGWNYKAVNHLNSGGKLQTSNDEKTQEAIIELGVGKNMVNAIKYWAEATSAIKIIRQQSTVDHESSSTGLYVFDENTGKDPYLEHIGSVWLIHFWLNFNDKELTAYRYFFNYFNGEHFEKLVLISNLSDDIGKLVSNDVALNDSTIKKDIDVFLNTYCKKSKNLKTETKTLDEEQFNSPLAELNLVKDHGRGFFISDLNEKQDLPIEIFIYALIKFIEKEANISKVFKINFDSLLKDRYSPGRIFRLSEKGLGLKLDEAQQVTNEGISWSDSLGLRQIMVDEKLINNTKSILDNYYKAVANG
ncbi:hypothetical protein A9Q98_06315 [Thalassotalea sp. 42_200_T64]|nr:hypothetical protein A9Q98_06315 [Thalassotalea sp. 42_200_T64]